MDAPPLRADLGSSAFTASPVTASSRAALCRACSRVSSSRVAGRSMLSKRSACVRAWMSTTLAYGSCSTSV